MPARVAYVVRDFYALGMRTTLDIPEELLVEAQRVARLSTKREAVIAGLKELIRKAHREDLRSLAGKLELDVDLQQTRKKRGG